MKSCAFVFVHTPHICMALTITFHDKDNADHDESDYPADHVLDHHDNANDANESQPALRTIFAQAARCCLCLLPPSR